MSYNEVAYNNMPQFLTLKVHGCRPYPPPVNKLPRHLITEKT